MEKTGLDMRQVMVLFQRRYNSIREIDRLTDELSEAMARNDEVSVALVLQMRADEMAKFDDCTNEIWQMSSIGREALRKIRTLIQSDPEEAISESPEEKKIYEIRRKTQAVIDRIRVIDERLNRIATGKESFYGSGVRSAGAGEL